MYCYHYTTCTKSGQWAVMCIVTIILPVQSQDNERSCVLLPLHYLYKARTMSDHMYCHHYTTCTKPGKWAVMCTVTITLHVQSQVNEPSCVLLPLHYLYKVRTMSCHVDCYHYTTCTKPGQTITLPVQSQEQWAVLCNVTITLPVQSQNHERSYVLLPCTIPVQSQGNERSCVLLPLHYLYKAMKMNRHVHCYHYNTCSKPGQWVVMCIVTITLSVQRHENERSFSWCSVLLPLHYL